MENEYGILEIEINENGDPDKKEEKFILDKIQEAIDEDVWYTEEEVIDSLDRLEKENKKCIKSFTLKEQK